LTHIYAKRSDLVFYHGFHFNVSTSQPAIVMHLDYLPIDPTPSTNRVLQEVYEERAKESIPVNAGTGNRTDIEKEYYKVKGMPPMPEDDLAQTVLGNKSWQWFDENHKDFFADKWGVANSQKFVNFRKQLYEQGYVVIHPSDVWDYHPDAMSYYEVADCALFEFADFFNYAMFGRLGREEKIKFDDRGDKMWDILSSTKKCEEIMGDKHFMNIAKKDEDGKWQHSKTAQGGQTNVAISHGMGQATNFVRGEYALQLSCHRFVVEAFQQLYQHRYLHNCCERWRVKCGVSDLKADIFPKYNLMPIHIDVEPEACKTIQTTPVVLV
jgi:hypothetical protein